MILTYGDLLTESKTIPLSKRNFYENAKFNKNLEYDVFISHSYLDKDLINALYYKFEQCGYTVYIDWKDEKLKDRNKITKDVANKLKENMNNSKGLLFVATDNSSESKWCPWELGYVDGLKNRTAILPILEKKTSEYKGQEYLGIYPYITYAKVKDKEKFDFWVNDPENSKKYSTLKQWLKSGELNLHQ